jgi:hypothetical protein
MSFPVVFAVCGGVVHGRRLDEAAVLNPSCASLFDNILVCSGELIYLTMVQLPSIQGEKEGCFLRRWTQSTLQLVVLEVDDSMDFLCAFLL